MICRKPGHKHAEKTTCYYACRCRCTPCVERNKADRRKWAAWRAAGINDRGRVDATTARAHAQRLVDDGATVYAIAKRAGLDQSTVQALLAGRWERVDYTTHERILRVRVTRGLNVPSYRIRRRLGALQALGYPLPFIADQAGVAPSTLRKIMAGDREGVRQSVAKAVVRVYAQFEGRPASLSGDVSVASITRARRAAARRRFAPPAAWDDIDDPREQPKGVAA